MLFMTLCLSALAAEPKPLDPRVHPQVDYTAYTLDTGEVRLGLASLGFGFMPRVHVSTVPVADAFGLYNGAIKWNAVRAGPLDVAAVAGHWFLPARAFRGSLTHVSGQTSLMLSDRVALHGAATFTHAAARGSSDFVSFAPLLFDVEQEELEAWAEQGGAPRASAELVTVRVAADWWFAREHAIVLQAQATPVAIARLDLSGGEAPPILGLDGALEAGGEQPIAATYAITASWQMSLPHFDLRLGGGASAIPLAWVLPATDVAFRFGGRSRRDPVPTTAAQGEGEATPVAADVGADPVPADWVDPTTL